MSSDLSSQHVLHTLYRDHRDWLVALLRRRLGGNLDHAADLAQDTFERIMRRDLAPVLPEPRAYLTTVANRLVISHYRRAAIEAAYLEALALRADACAPSTEERMEVIQALEQLCDWLGRLDARARTIFLLSQFDGMPYAEIASRMDVSIDTVKRTMSKALQHCYMALHG